MGLLYATGDGVVPKDAGQAAIWYRDGSLSLNRQCELLAVGRASLYVSCWLFPYVVESRESSGDLRYCGARTAVALVGRAPRCRRRRGRFRLSTQGVRRMLRRGVSPLGRQPKRLGLTPSSAAASVRFLSPTDSGLLRDAVRVLARLLVEARGRLGLEVVKFHDWRVAKRRVLDGDEIARDLRPLTAIHGLRYCGCVGWSRNRISAKPKSGRATPPSRHMQKAEYGVGFLHTRGLQRRLRCRKSAYRIRTTRRCGEW